jgi:hypothetical protein
MSARTYIPQLIHFLEKVCKYVGKYQSQLNTFLSPEQETLLANIVTACNLFIAAIGVLPIGD